MLKNYSPVVALAHTPPYKIHKYFARRPWNVFDELINDYSGKDSIVLDPFCGGGVTIYEGLRMGRRVIGCDLNPLSILLVRNMIKKGELTPVFYKVLQEINDYIEYLYNGFNTFIYNNKEYKISWCELAFKIVCNTCGKEIILDNAAKAQNGYYFCQNPECYSRKINEPINVNECERAGYKYLSLVSLDDNTKIVKPFDSDDELLVKKHIKFLDEILKNDKISMPQDKIPMNWDRQYEDSLFKKGIIYFQDLFTERNNKILNILLNKFKEYKIKLGDAYELLRLIFSNVVKDCNDMAFTNDGWQSGKPITWSKHAYWVPNQFCEMPIYASYSKSCKRIIDTIKFNDVQFYEPSKAASFSDFCNNRKNVYLINDSIANSDIVRDSVDAIITDPPYGSNVQYLELSHFWYIWNKDLYSHSPNFNLEAVSNRKSNFEGHKDMYDYENNLYSVYCKSYDVLKPGGYMAFTFNNKDIRAWLSLLFAVFRAGFTIADECLFFQDGVKNYKQTAHTKAKGALYGDYIYVFTKNVSYKPLFIYNDEASFVKELDDHFKEYLTKKSDDVNKSILEMFKTALPKIEGFAKSYLKEHQHNLFNHFNKTYFNKYLKNGQKK